MKKRGLVTLLCLCCIGTNLGNYFVNMQTPITKTVAIANAKETKTTKETEKTTKKEILKKLQNNLLLMEILDSSIPEKNYNKKVKRKEFAKLLVNVSVYKDNKKATSTSASYSDLSSKSTYAGYVKTAVENEWMTGYLDGTFKPNEGIKVKDATKAILTLLGYSNSDFTGNKVDARMSKFNALDLNENINKTKNQSLTWQDMLYLLDNLLNTETKEGVIYAKTLGYALNNNGQIDYQNVLKQVMDGPILAEKNWDKSISIKKKNAIVYRNEKLSNWDAIELYDVLYYAKNSNTIWAYDNKITGKVTAISPNRMNPETVMIDDVTYQLGNEDVIDEFSMDGNYEVDDFVTLFLGVDNEVAIARNIKEYNEDIDNSILLKSCAEEPILATKNWEDTIPVTKKNATVYRNEKLSKWSKIEEYDVLYYFKELNMIWAYDNKVTGKITAISPNQMNPETVTIGSTTYTLGNEEIRKQFSMEGAYGLEDIVTLFLGVNGNAAIAKSIEEYNEDIDNSILLESCAEEPILAVKDWEDTIPVTKKTAMVYRNEKLSKWSKIEEYDVLYYSKELNTIWAYDNKVTGKITAISPNQMNPETITLNGTTYVLGNEDVIDAFSMDGAYGVEDVVTLFLGVNDEVAVVKNIAEYNIDIDYNTLLESCMDGPILAEENWEDDIPVTKETAIVYRDEKLSTWEEIKEYDVLYYSKDLNTVWSYDNKVTGKITEISPNRVNPETITVAGSTYTLETNEAKNQLSMKGTYNVNDTVTLFLGLDNKVVALKDTVEYNNTIYGAVLETGTMATTSSSSNEILENYLVLMDTKGRKHTYIYDALEYTVSANTAVEISYLSEGSPVVKKASAPSTSFYGFRVNDDGTAIGNYKIAENATIIDIYQSEYEILSPRELAGVSLNGANILYYSCSEEGVIDEMILYGVSGCGYQYGMITGLSKSGKQYTYTYMTKNGTKTTNVDEINPYLNVGTCCRIFEYDFLNTVYFTAIGQQEVTELSESYIKTEHFTIIPTNEILIYYTKNGNYYATTLSKIKDLSQYDVTAYYEDSTTMAKKVHFLVAKKKS